MNQMNNEQIILYKSRLKEFENNIDNVTMYSKGNCKHCYGRGLVKQVIPVKPKTTLMVQEWPTEICGCVLKKLEKEIVESLKSGPNI